MDNAAAEDDAIANEKAEPSRVSDFLITSIPVCAFAVFIVGSCIVGYVFYVVSKLEPLEATQPLAEEVRTTASDKKGRNKEAVAGGGGKTTDEALVIATYNLAQKQLAVRSVQLAAGYGVGFLCVSSGIILAWCGVSGRFEFKIGDGKRTVSLNTGSIGTAVIFIGAALIAISMWSRPIKVQSNAGLKFESRFGEGTANGDTGSFEF